MRPASMVDAPASLQKRPLADHLLLEIPSEPGLSPGGLPRCLLHRPGQGNMRRSRCRVLDLAG